MSTQITLTGSDEAQQKAKELIDDLLTERPPSPQQSTNDNQRHDPDEFKDFDWGKANRDYVRDFWYLIP